MKLKHLIIPFSIIVLMSLGMRIFYADNIMVSQVLGISPFSLTVEESKHVGAWLDSGYRQFKIKLDNDVLVKVLNQAEPLAEGDQGGFYIPLFRGSKIELNLDEYELKGKRGCYFVIDRRSSPEPYLYLQTPENI